jgi:hypothetical protein
VAPPHDAKPPAASRLSTVRREQVASPAAAGGVAAGFAGGGWQAGWSVIMI